MFDMFTWVEKTELWERVTTFARTAAAFEKPFWLGSRGRHGSPKCVWQGQGKATAFCADCVGAKTIGKGHVKALLQED